MCVVTGDWCLVPCALFAIDYGSCVSGQGPFVCLAQAEGLGDRSQNYLLGPTVRPFEQF